MESQPVALVREQTLSEIREWTPDQLSNHTYETIAAAIPVVLSERDHQAARLKEAEEEVRIAQQLAAEEKEKLGGLTGVLERLKQAMAQKLARI